jgi:hypothetical protein
MAMVVLLESVSEPPVQRIRIRSRRAGEHLVLRSESAPEHWRRPLVVEHGRGLAARPRLPALIPAGRTKVTGIVQDGFSPP